jgi:hypothetical protein
VVNILLLNQIKQKLSYSWRVTSSTANQNTRKCLSIPAEFREHLSLQNFSCFLKFDEECQTYKQSGENLW